MGSPSLIHVLGWREGAIHAPFKPYVLIASELRFGYHTRVADFAPCRELWRAYLLLLLTFSFELILVPRTLERDRLRNVWFLAYSSLPHILHLSRQYQHPLIINTLLKWQRLHSHRLKRGVTTAVDWKRQHPNQFLSLV